MACTQEQFEKFIKEMFSTVDEYEDTTPPVPQKTDLEIKVDAEMEFVTKFGSSYCYDRNNCHFIMKTKESMRECLEEMILEGEG